ncbi:hypothetical protein Tco_0842470 [Tanacetum coccineum]|uniref:Uncharacterized protein n=1 Tax=Tanacetum coccineum TaxID=301880 RepID=A0ABQ5B2N5_9ASTR
MVEGGGEGKRLYYCFLDGLLRVAMPLGLMQVQRGTFKGVCWPSFTTMGCKKTMEVSWIVLLYLRNSFENLPSRIEENVCKDVEDTKFVSLNWEN